MRHNDPDWGPPNEEDPDLGDVPEEPMPVGDPIPGWEWPREIEEDPLEIPHPQL